MQLTDLQANSLAPLLQNHTAVEAMLAQARKEKDESELAITDTLRAFYLTNCGVQIGDLVEAYTPDRTYGPFFLHRVVVKENRNYRTGESAWIVEPYFRRQRKDGSMGETEPSYRELPHRYDTVLVRKVTP